MDRGFAPNLRAERLSTSMSEEKLVAKAHEEEDKEGPSRACNHTWLGTWRWRSDAGDSRLERVDSGWVRLWHADPELAGT